MDLKTGKAAIIGVGLLGASLGMEWRHRKLVGHVLGIGRREASLQVALEKGAIDAFSLDWEDAADADLIVVATPAALVEPVLDALRPMIKPKAIVTDVASTKSAICRHADLTWRRPRRFVGSHPMAGAEAFGPEHGRLGFYENTVCLVERNVSVDREAMVDVEAMWMDVGATVVRIEPDIHDQLLARTSHLPHVLASLMAEVAGRENDISPFIGNGYKDFTRIAAGRPEIWRDIVLTNREAILESLTSVELGLTQFRQALETGNAVALEAFFEAGRQARLRAME